MDTQWQRDRLYPSKDTGEYGDSKKDTSLLCYNKYKVQWIHNKVTNGYTIE